MLVAAVLGAWRLAPESTLAAFLAVSVWHFGTEEVEGGRELSVLALGGLPVALPVLPSGPIMVARTAWV
ncbi:Brp/Blh family beta-carotene 15,15'-dioxygenase [Methylobacterium sp. J-088]|uniref:Brp/Blh family beta-carotene 15,15'-dioxygenase n=1 Tax=Methylobacterium sp. J-088 TaxID=2836664 RepID=UPI003918721C